MALHYPTRLSLLALVLCASLPTLADTTEVFGLITDYKCGRRNPESAGVHHAQCARMCVREGDNYALSTDDGQIYKLKPKSGEVAQLNTEIEQLMQKGFYRFTVTGVVEGDTVIVEKLEPTSN